MSLTIAVHSYKGGSGKTSFAINLASAYASVGKSVCLLDVDLKAPSSFNYLLPEAKRWVNDVFEGRYGVMDVVMDVSKEMGTAGAFDVGYSNPDILAVRDVSSKDRKWQSKALKFLMNAKRDLSNIGIDVVILDTGAGVDFTSVNAIAVADHVVMVGKPGASRQRAIDQVVKGIYIPLEKNCSIVENMGHANNSTDLSYEGQFDLPVLASIPCMCDVAVRCDNEVLVLTEPEHSFSKNIFNAMRAIDKLTS
ncbi:ParA family protein [Methanococcoides burtonii]|uniref:Protein with CobQ/CobB/MinD/ParA nucleotide binding domain n=1 Tax=Methanococcoides burtonii (strain DSM 6242 / NBRC 107633 / OCM 468 / ACE-M) TaxID=259564 RepID=Q12UK5_METBU|nr:ParA family protein [Methanococcoides burtonii]ABE52871.1 protein with CobQ/CobB/MinD/ParA nucleotide binding domain [Methanococcoides burtonii DSM 6242]